MQISIRDLYDQIFAFEGTHLFESILKPWVIENEYKTYILTVSNKIQSNKVDLSQDDVWELYALNRVLDILTLGFQPDNKADGDWTGTDLTLSEYIAFTDQIGLETGVPAYFHSFDCEIMEAQEGETDFKITEHCFPAVKLKNLMIKRAGVKISLNPQHFDLTQINAASIYWTSRRKNRKYQDQSQGWGSNSQWRTDLRLDLETTDHFIYNLQGTFDLTKATNDQQYELYDLELQEAIELTRFRHLMQSAKDDTDLYPYSFRYVEKKN